MPLQGLSFNEVVEYISVGSDMLMEYLSLFALLREARLNLIILVYAFMESLSHFDSVLFEVVGTEVAIFGQVHTYSMLQSLVGFYYLLFILLI